MTVRDLILKMKNDERLVINGDDFYYFHTTPDELTNEKDEYLDRIVEMVRYSHVFNAITIEVYTA